MHLNGCKKCWCACLLSLNNNRQIASLLLTMNWIGRYLVLTSPVILSFFMGPNQHGVFRFCNTMLIWLRTISLLQNMQCIHKTNDRTQNLALQIIHDDEHFLNSFLVKLLSGRYWLKWLQFMVHSRVFSMTTYQLPRTRWNCFFQ